METDRPRPTKESLSTRQELLNNIYTRFLSFPSMDVDVYRNGNLRRHKFSYHFPKGTTTEEYSDQLSGKYIVKDGSLVIFYAKGIHAGRITLKKNPETNSVDLTSYAVYKKNPEAKDGGSPMVRAARKKSGESNRPQLHAVVSLLNDIENKMKLDPELFKDKRNEAEEKRIALLRKLHGQIKGRIVKKERIEMAKRKRNRNGRK